MRCWGALPLAALIAGCMGPRPPVPADAAVAPPAQWRQWDAPTHAVTSLWWKDLGDPVLDDLVEQALRGNPDLQIAATRVREARAQFARSASYLKPSLAVVSDGGRSRTLDAFGKGLDQSSLSGEATISYELDLFGRISASARAAQASLDASEFAREAMRTALTATVVSGYVTLRGLDAKLAIANATLAERDAERKLVQRRFSVGYAPRLDIEQAQAACAAAAQLVPTTQAAITSQENAMNALLGRMPGPIARGKGLSGLNGITMPTALPSDLLRQRPDIAEAEAKLAATDHELDAARAAFMPRIQLSADAGAVGSTALSSPVTLFSLGGSLLAPLFSGGALRAGADSASARRDQMAYAYRQTVLQSFQEVETAMSGVDSAEHALQAALAQEDANRSLLKLAQRRYRAGYASYLEQLDAERSLLSMQLQVVDLQTRRLVQMVTLYRGLGGGWHTATRTPVVTQATARQ